MPHHWNLKIIAKWFESDVNHCFLVIQRMRNIKICDLESERDKSFDDRMFFSEKIDWATLCILHSYENISYLLSRHDESHTTVPLKILPMFSCQSLEVKSRNIGSYLLIHFCCISLKTFQTSILYVRRGDASWGRRCVMRWGRVLRTPALTADGWVRVLQVTFLRIKLAWERRLLKILVRSTLPPWSPEKSVKLFKPIFGADDKFM